MKVGYYIKIDGKWQLEKEWLNKAFNLVEECYYYADNDIWWHSSTRASTQSNESYFRCWKDNSPPPEEDLTLIMLQL